MIKYTKEYCKTNDIVVVCDNIEEFIKIREIEPNFPNPSISKLEQYFLKGACYFYDRGWDEVFYSGFAYHKGSCTAEQFIKDNIILPKKWMIKITEENHTFLDRYLETNSEKYPDYSSNWSTANTYSMEDGPYYFYSEQPLFKAHSSTSKYNGFTEITFEEFLEITGQTNLIEFPKELIQLLKQIK